jgi:hypothetical protein
MSPTAKAHVSLREESTSLRHKSINVATVHDRTAQTLMYITESELRLTLFLNLDRMEKQGAWKVPLAFFVPTALAMVTADFDKRFGLSGDFWLAVFFLTAVISLGWLVRTLYQERNRVEVDDIVEELKSGDIGKKAPRNDHWRARLSSFWRGSQHE